MSHLSKIQTIATRLLKGRTLFEHNIKVLAAEDGVVQASFLVSKEHLNVSERLFGGHTAALVDIGGSLAIASKVESINVGVSTDLSVSFLASAKEGDEVLIVSECSKAGKNLAFSTVKMFVDKKQIASGSHSKFMGSSKGYIKQND